MKKIQKVSSKKNTVTPKIYGAKYAPPTCNRCGGVGNDGPCFDTCGFWTLSASGVIREGYAMQKS